MTHPLTAPPTSQAVGSPPAVGDRADRTQRRRGRSAGAGDRTARHRLDRVPRRGRRLVAASSRPPHGAASAPRRPGLEQVLRALARRATHRPTFLRPDYRSAPRGSSSAITSFGGALFSAPMRRRWEASGRGRWSRTDLWIRLGAAGSRGDRREVVTVLYRRHSGELTNATDQASGGRAQPARRAREHGHRPAPKAVQRGLRSIRGEMALESCRRAVRRR